MDEIMPIVKIQENKDWNALPISLFFFLFPLLKSKKTRIEMSLLGRQISRYLFLVKIQENKDWNCSPPFLSTSEYLLSLKSKKTRIEIKNKGKEA